MQTLLHIDAFTNRRFYTHTFTPGEFYTKTLLQADTCTHRRFYTQTLLPKHIHTQRLLHTEAFTHRRFYTQKLVHRETFTHRRTLLHTGAFTHKHFYAQRPHPWNRNFTAVFWRKKKKIQNPKKNINLKKNSPEIFGKFRIQNIQEIQKKTETL